MKKFLDKIQLQRVLEDVKGHLDKKQETLTGQTGQVVGFDADGKAVPQEPPVPPDAVTVPGGGEIEMDESLGEGPYTFEYTEDADGSAVQASQVSYDAAESGLAAATVQGALDALSVSASRVSNQNLLDNWYFADPIDQRQGHIVPPGTDYYSDSGMTQQAGTTTEYMTAAQSGSSWTITVGGNTCYVSGEAVVRGYTGPGYTIDRWKISGGGTVILNEDGTITLHAGNQEMWFGQGFEWQVNNEKMTGSILVTQLTGTGHLLLLHASGAFTGIQETGLTTYTAMLPDYVEFRIVVPVGCSITIKVVKLELGPVQTLAHKEGDTWVLNDPPPNKTLELAKCQRYQLFIANVGQWYASAINYISGVAFIPTPVPMRCNPTIYKFGPNNPQDYGACYISTNSIRITDIGSVGTATKDGVSVALTGLSRDDYGGCGTWGEVGLMLDANL